MLSATVKSPTSPSSIRSSGTWATPAVYTARGSFSKTVPLMRTSPWSTSRRPVIASTSSLCPLPWTPAMATISPACTVRSRPFTAGWPRSSRTTRSRSSSTGSAGLAGDLFTTRSTSRPTIIVASSSRVVSAGSRRADDPAAAQDRDPVRDLEDLVELVGDEDDRRAALDERAHDREELLGLLRREDGRRLVEDEDVGLAIQRLEDLDALPDADRQVLDEGIGVDLEAMALRDLDDPGSRGAPVERADRPAGVLHAEHDVLGDGEDRDEHEVLVDHADAGRDRVARTAELRPALSSMRISPSSGGVEPVEDVHEGRLARAVLAEQAEDLAGLHDEIDPLIGHDPGEALGDPPQLELHSVAP